MTLQAPRLTLMVVGRRNWILSSALGMNTNSVWVDECNWTGAKFAKTIRRADSVKRTKKSGFRCGVQ